MLPTAIQAYKNAKWQRHLRRISRRAVKTYSVGGLHFYLVEDFVPDFIWYETFFVQTAVNYLLAVIIYLRIRHRERMLVDLTLVIEWFAPYVTRCGYECA